MLENQRLTWNLFWLRRCVPGSRPYRKRFTAVVHLLGQDAAISRPDAQWLLSQPATYGRLGLPRYLLKKGATLVEGQMLLVAALKAGNANMAYWLLAKGMRPYPGLVHQAVLLGYVKLLKRLKVSGANMREKNQYGNTALHLAVSEGTSLEVVKYLARVCDLNAKNNQGWTALYDCGVRYDACGKHSGPHTLNDQYVEVLLDTPGIRVDHIGPTPFGDFFKTNSTWDRTIRKKLRAIRAVPPGHSEDSYSSASTVRFYEPERLGPLPLQSQFWEMEEREDVMTPGDYVALRKGKQH